MSSEDPYLNLIQTMAETLARVNETQEKQIEQQDILLQRIQDLSMAIELNSDISNAHMSINEDLKDVIKEFSIYASNREMADTHLRENMTLLSTMWENSIALFAETKTLVEDIHKIASTIQTHNISVLSEVDSPEFPEVNMLQGWLTEYYCEIIHKFASVPFTFDVIQKWVKSYLSDYNKEHGTAKMPQNLDLKERIEWSDKFINCCSTRFGLNQLVKHHLWSCMLMFHSILFGKKFVEYPKLSFIFEQLREFEEKLYA